MLAGQSPLLSARFGYVLFDLGGTLIYFDGEWPEVLGEAIQTAVGYLRSVGYLVDEQVFPEAYLDLMMNFYQKRSDEEVEYTAAFVLSEALRHHGFPSAEQDHLRQALKILYAVSQSHWHPEEDAAPMLAKLAARGCRMGIVSNASDDEDVQTLVDRAGLRGYFDFILTSASVGYRKPSPVIFQQALSFWNASPGKAVMIGDTVPADIAGASRSGLASVWIKRRADTPENHAAALEFAPDRAIQTLSELPGLLADWCD